jgi:hypothetical protein
MRVFDRDLIRGGHYGQRSCEPHLQAEHMAAPTKPACLCEWGLERLSHSAGDDMRDGVGEESAAEKVGGSLTTERPDASALRIWNRCPASTIWNGGRHQRIRPDRRAAAAFDHMLIKAAGHNAEFAPPFCSSPEVQ